MYRSPCTLLALAVREPGPGLEPRDPFEVADSGISPEVGVPLASRELVRGVSSPLSNALVAGES